MMLILYNVLIDKNFKNNICGFGMHILYAKRFDFYIIAIYYRIGVRSN